MTTAQQRFYWAAILPAAVELNIAPDCESAHEQFKRWYLTRYTFDTATGEQTGETVGSTMTLSHRETQEYFDRIKSFFSAMKAEFPAPVHA